MSDENEKDKEKNKRKKNPFVEIAAICSAMIVACLVVTLLFAQSWVMVPVASSLAVMGIALGYFASKKG